MGFYKGEIQYCSKKIHFSKGAVVPAPQRTKNSPEIPMTGKFVDERGVLTPDNATPSQYTLMKFIIKSEAGIIWIVTNHTNMNL